MKFIYLCRKSIGVVVASLFALSISSIELSAKEFRTKTGIMDFKAIAPAKLIVAKSKNVSIVLNTQSKQVSVEIPVNSFTFDENYESNEKNEALFKRFSEHYMRSMEYPLIRYIGEIQNLSEIDFTKDGTYSIRSRGKLSIVKVEQTEEVNGIIIIKNGEISVTTEVKIVPDHYRISFPRFLNNNYFKEIVVNATAVLK
jgi:hypothetical protein